MSAKYCPLKMLDGKMNLCVEKNCAWWDSFNEQCAVMGIRTSLFNINYQLGAKNNGEEEHG